MSSASCVARVSSPWRLAPARQPGRARRLLVAAGDPGPAADFPAETIAAFGSALRAKASWQGGFWGGALFAAHLPARARPVITVCRSCRCKRELRTSIPTFFCLPPPPLLGAPRPQKTAAVLAWSPPQRHPSHQLLALQCPQLAAEGAWATPLAGPRAGALLLAMPAAAAALGPDYWQAVVLLLQHSSPGGLGMVLNRPTNARVAQGADGLLLAVEVSCGLGRRRWRRCMRCTHGGSWTWSGGSKPAHLVLRVGAGRAWAQPCCVARPACRCILSLRRP